MTDLGRLPGSHSAVVFAINDHAQIVGWCTLDGNVTTGAHRAVLWYKGQVVDINTLLPSDSGWVMEDCYAINRYGQIVASGTFNGNKASALLTPQY